MKKYEKLGLIIFCLLFSIMLIGIGSSYAYFSYTKKGNIKNNLATGKLSSSNVTLRGAILAANPTVYTNPTLTNSSNNTSDASGLYKSTATNSGSPTYYFRGNVTNNYVEFAGFVWRIVRINEDGTVRIVMQDGINNTAYKISSAVGNKTNMYYSNSDIGKPTLETWYQTNIVDKGYSDNVVTGNYFCEQAKVTNNSTYGTNSGANMTVYSSYKPDFKCSTDGNGKGIVNSSVGLLSYDEVVHAGGYWDSTNSNYYLYNSSIYWWTMSPAGYTGSQARMWRGGTNGGLNSYSVGSTSYQLRAVINLKGDIPVVGTGISSDPYAIAENLDDAILKNPIITATPTLSTSFNNTSDATGLYKSTATNSGKPTYYFRGKVTNNYLDFAGFTWRIVRINEDGSIRIMMTDGINDNQTVRYASGTGAIDYMYYSHNSNAKTSLDAWYSKYMSYYDNYIETGEYCEQVKVTSNSGYTSGNATTVYRTNYTNPDFKCLADDGNGYGIVNSKIGLITVEEFIYTGGGINKANTNHFLHNATAAFWTMSPAGYASSTKNSYVWKVSASSGITYSYINAYADNHFGSFRPVINLKADTLVTGAGTSTSHFKVLGALDRSDLIEDNYD